MRQVLVLIGFVGMLMVGCGSTNKNDNNNTVENNQTCIQMVNREGCLSEVELTKYNLLTKGTYFQLLDNSEYVTRYYDYRFNLEFVRQREYYKYDEQKQYTKDRGVNRKWYIDGPRFYIYHSGSQEIETSYRIQKSDATSITIYNFERDLACTLWTSLAEAKKHFTQNEEKCINLFY